MDLGDWYLEVNGRKVGPFTLDQIQGLLNDGEIRAYHQVTSKKWADDGSAWRISCSPIRFRKPVLNYLPLLHPRKFSNPWSRARLKRRRSPPHLLRRPSPRLPRIRPSTSRRLMLLPSPKWPQNILLMHPFNRLPGRRSILRCRSDPSDPAVSLFDALQVIRGLSGLPLHFSLRQ